jgi:outer membrane protein
MKRVLVAAGALLAAASFGAIAASAEETGNAGAVMGRLRGIGVIPDERSTISVIGGAVDATNTVVPEADVTYFATDHIAFELIAAVTKHSAVANATAAGAVDLGKVWLLPPTLTAQYHFDLGGTKPYVGAGINYTTFFSVTLPKTGPVIAIHYGDSVGPALQAGIDVPLAPKWYLNFDVKKVWIKSEVKINGGAINASVHLDPWIVGAGFGYRF